MKANKIMIRNFRGCEEKDVILSGIDILTGSNGIGKTRLLQALQLAVSGVVPHPIEERNIEPIELFTRQIGKMDMHIALAFDGAYFQRNFDIVVKKDVPSVTQSIDTPEKTVGPEEGARYIKDLLGDFPYMLDMHKFIRLSDEKRAELIMKFGAFNAEEWTPENIRLKLFEKVYTEHLDENIAETAMKTVSALMKTDVRAGLIALMEWLKKETSVYKKEMKNFSATSQGAAMMMKTDGKTSMRPAETIREELDKARADWSELSAQIHKAESEKEQYDKMQVEAITIEATIAGIKEVASSDKITDLTNEIVHISEGVPELPKDHYDGGLALEKGVREAQTALEDAKMLVVRAESNLETLHEKANLLKDGKCPVCGQPTGEVVEGIGTAIDNATIEISDAKESVKVYEHALEASKTALVNHTKITDEVALKGNEADKVIRDLESRIELMKEKIASIATQENRLQVIRNYKYENSLNLDEAHLQLEGLSKRGTALNEELEKRITYDTELRLAKEAAKRRAEVELANKTVVSLLELAKEFRWQVVREALAPVKDKATELFSNNAKDLSSSPVTFDFMFEDARGNEAFKFGWRTSTELGEMFIDFDSLSTAQQMFTLVAVLSPLIELGNPKFKALIIDNIEVVEELNRIAFEKLLRDAKAICNLDNILVASSGSYPVMDGINVVTLT